jgi:hypothetical protein
MAQKKYKLLVGLYVSLALTMLMPSTALAQGLSKAETKIFNEATIFYTQKSFADLRQSVVSKGGKNAETLATLDKIKEPLIECAAGSMQVALDKPEARRELVVHYQAVRAGKLDYQKNADGSQFPGTVIAALMMAECLK